MSHTSKVHNRVLYQFCVVCFCAAVSLLGFSASEAWALTNVSAHHTVSYSKSELPIDCAQCHPAEEVSGGSEYLFYAVSVHNCQVYSDCGICHDALSNSDVADAFEQVTWDCQVCHANQRGENFGHSSAQVAPKHDASGALENATIQCDQCHEGAQNLTSIHTNCATCHGFGVSDAVKAAVQSGSLSCENIGCHAGIHLDTTPKHDATEVLKTQILDCTQCHEAAADLTATHKTCSVCHSATASDAVKSAVKLKNKSCDACHGVVHADVASAHTSKYPVVAGLDCASCHGVLEGISSPKLHKSCATCHGADVSDKVKAAVAAGDTNCATCHGAIHADVNELHAQPYPDLGLDCASCHGAASSLMDKNLHGGCVTCHGPNAPANVKAAVASGDANCQTCHTDIHTGVGSFHRSSYPDVAGLDCVSCHGESVAVSDTSLHSSCNMCHSSNASAAVKTAVKTGNKACTACHGTIHANVDSTHTAIYPEVQGLDCASCHGEGTAISATKLHSNCGLCHGSNVSSTVKAAVAAGNRNCSACHSNIHADLDGAHASAFPEVSGLDCASCHGAASTLSATTLHKNCNLCHGADASDKVKDAVANGKTDCASCHGKIHSNVDGAHKAPAVYQNVCGRCHGTTLIGKGSGYRGLGSAHTCRACHSSKNELVKKAILNGDTSCTSCHPNHHMMRKLSENGWGGSSSGSGWGGSGWGGSGW